jgi:diguanylate cyclase (GGDEF)-like protein
MADDKTIIADPSGVSVVKGGPIRKQACLVQYNGTTLGRRYNIERNGMVCGRSPDVDIVVNEKSLSRQHAKFHVSADGQVSVEDLNATNGTFVNDAKIVATKQELKDGDILRLGTVLFKFYGKDNVDNLFHDKIYRMVTIDNGTQIFNKKYLTESLETEFRFAKLYERPLSLIYYDLDHFKKVNDTHGHSVGDFILKESAAITSSTIRKNDIFGRVGGEEFCIVLPDTELKVACDLAERIRKAIESYVFRYSDDLELNQTISMGVAAFNTSMQDYDQLLDAADKKLYESKNTGRNKISS